MTTALQRFIRAMASRLVARRRASSRADSDGLLILFFNTMWGDPLRLEYLDLPRGTTLTADRARFRDADAVVFHVPGLRRLPRRRKRRGQLWVAWSLESETNYPLLRDPRFMRRFDLTMTYRRNADVPLCYVGYYDLRELPRTLTQPPRPKTRGNLANLFVSSGFDASGRCAYATELMRHLDVHSYGAFRNNRRLPRDRGRATKLDTIADYKFTLAFENAISIDYVTEKFFDPLVAGSVPVYLGAPNVDAFAPGDHCFIDTRDFDEPRALAAYLKALDEDDAAYRRYFAWKEQPLRPTFLQLLREQADPTFVRLARTVAARVGRVDDRGSGAADRSRVVANARR